MNGTGVHLDLGGQLRRGECLTQHILRLRLTLVVALGDGEEIPCLHLRYEQMRAVRFVGHQTAAVKGGSRADAIGKRRRRAHRDRSAHAVTHGPHPALAVDGGLAVEPGDECPGISDHPIGRQRTGQLHEGSACRRILEISVLGSGGCPLRPVERVDDQDRVA